MADYAGAASELGNARSLAFDASLRLSDFRGLLATAERLAQDAAYLKTPGHDVVALTAFEAARTAGHMAVRACAAVSGAVVEITKFYEEVVYRE